MVAEFLTSENALTYLGLPGLAIILAFLFYNALVKSGIVTNLGQRQSFVILLTIIAYFTIATALAFWTFSSGAVLTTKPKEVDLEGLMQKVSLRTPTSTLVSELGSPISLVKTEGLSINRFEVGDERYLQTFENEQRTIAFAGFDPRAKLKIPTISYGVGQADGSTRTFSRLSDFTLTSSLAECLGQYGSEWAGRGNNVHVGPCRGAGSSANYFYLFFMGPAVVSEACFLALLSGDIAPGSRTFKSCDNEVSHPTGFVVLDRDTIDAETSSFTAENEDLTTTQFILDWYLKSWLNP